MRDAAQNALDFIGGRTREDLDRDRMLYGALNWSLTIIGEAAAQLTPETRTALAEVPWSNIVGMRNRLVHGYYLIDPDIVWDTVIRHLAPLVSALETWLATQTDDVEISE